MKALVSTRKDTLTTGTVTVKINGATSMIPVQHNQRLDYNRKSYLFLVGTSCCVYYALDEEPNADGNHTTAAGKLLCSGPEVELDI
ncbi:MAG TPA: hypothetical protein PLV19_03330 [Nitrosomonas sp.]|nr:hypothetical protein [Nitrosomonas sp.]HQX13187.1 hypothetical protein [Nitrosomonas sp.]HRB32091.1 hypothetical protein [Nitrosomonas sp.]HRB45819.1 hypothetical protein [Nitrosomonas sp.]HRB77024.1 hypothetical protein [Nitrosomonas sp.]